MAPASCLRARSLLIDNWDSFTNNIIELIAEVTGHVPICLPNSAADAEVDAACALVDFVVISPGPGHPDVPSDFGVCAHVLRSCRLPILGVCLGMQGMALACGGQLIRTVDPRHGHTRQITHDRQTNADLFRNVPSPFTAVRYNSLAVNPDIAGDYRVLAWSSDPFTIMALDVPSKGWAGVQFHPESFLTQHGRTIVENFIQYYVPNRLTASAEHQAPPEAIMPTNALTRREVFLSHRRLQPGSSFNLEHLFRFMMSNVPGTEGEPSPGWSVWLDSAMGGRFSYLSVGGGQLHHTLRYNVESRIVVLQSGQTESIQQSFFDYIRDRLLSYKIDCNLDVPFDFVGGYCGWFGYEMKSECGRMDKNRYPSTLPDAAFAFVDRLVVFDHETSHLHLVALDDEERSEPSVLWMDSIERLLKAATECAQGTKITVHSSEERYFDCRDSDKEYEAKVVKCLDVIASGDAYELCLTTQFTAANARVAPFDLYCSLRSNNPAPFASFLDFDDVAVCCSSPERFMKVCLDRHVVCQPIKGTRARDTSSDEFDQQLKLDLLSSSKDRAENLMITDLIRHDLSRTCKTGSVTVSHFCQVMSYAHVHQLVSTITGQLRSESSAIDCIRAAFPPGSMTGAPKVRSLQVLEELESAPRGIYSGIIGFLSVNGTADFNVVIRSIVCDKARSTMDVGGGGAIVSLSTPCDELLEMKLKVAAPIRVATYGLASLNHLAA